MAMGWRSATTITMATLISTLRITGAISFITTTATEPFTDVTESARALRGGGWSVGAMFVDYDRDGRLDLVVSRYLDWDFSMDICCGEKKPGYRSYCHPDQFPANHALALS